ncbi:hypothetical protein MCUN1_003740 [Malassezia cuniculi]|uniref:Transcription initiation factor TFIID subunit 2 n=1 Tax=Malassezia cuniculi TaxID=948313 RepID=A0AAF0EU42_9BASI|nr:hypothetical protein MCUN1_003740 [Malassezia cuniculi]
MRRNPGFVLSHQRVALELQLSGVLGGYTEITIVPTDAALHTVHINSRRCQIQRVLCDGVETAFVHSDTLEAIEYSDVHRHPQLKRALFTSASEGAQGELSIQIPQHIRTALASHQSESAEGEMGEGLPPITLRIYYMSEDVHEAIQVVMPTSEAPFRVPHLYTRHTGPGSARCWVPCVDTLWDRCTWELEFVVPRHLASDGGDVPLIMVCSGELMEHAVHPHNPDKSIFYYSQPVATSVQHIAFSLGPFVMTQVRAPRRDRDRDRRQEPEIHSDSPEVLAFCLPEHEHELAGSVGFVRQALEFISSEYGSYPFGSFKMVFVDDTATDCYTSSTLAICSSDLLHPVSVIDQAFENRHILTHAVAFQWVGINIIQRSWADTWLIHGLSLHIASMFLRRLLGNNEYRFRMKKDCDRLCALDIGMPPLFQAGRTEPLDPQLLPFVNLKAPLVLYLLDRRLCKMGASLGLGRVIPKVFLQAITGEMSGNALGTHSFLRTCKKVSGADLRQFVDQWINGSGCPRFICTATFNRKKLLIEMHVRQESPAAIYAQTHPEDALASNPVGLWEGQMTVRIHEADGTPYEHVLDIKNEHQRYDVPFNTKYKRVRRNTKRFQARQAAAAAAAAGDEDAAEAIGMIDLGFGLGMWEDEHERTRWKVADWTEEDEAIMASAPYEWIRLDADFDWMAQINFEQPDYMWVSQLQRDRDVVAQLAAVHALSQMPSLITSSMLTRTVLVTKYFFRIRAEAAYGLTNCALPHLDLLGLFHLFMLFRTSYCFDQPGVDTPQAVLEAPCIPKPNDFSDMADYFVRRALILAISRVRDHTGKALPTVQRFLVNLLRYNDNSTNAYVDDFYVSSIINALASALIPADMGLLSARIPGIDDTYTQEEVELRDLAFQEIERLQELDRLVPSFHNVITLACMDFQLAMMYANLRPINLPHFVTYTREGNYAPVRCCAFNALLLLRGLDHKLLTRYFFAVLAHDESDIIRAALARGLCECLGVSLAIGIYGPPRPPQPEIVEVDADGPPPDPSADPANVEDERVRDEAHIDGLVRILRKEIGRSAAVRKGFLDAFASSHANAGMRSALLKLAELLFKPAAEARVASAPLPVRAVEPAKDSVPQEEQRAEMSLRVVLPKSGKPRRPRVIPGQESGMTSADLSACRNCISKLMANKHCEPFIHPVDPVRDEAPDYFDVIKEPMDLTSVANKLQAGHYRDRFQFKDDIELIFRNAKTYTPDPKAWIHYEASRSEAAFRQHWSRITKTLEQAAARAAAYGRPREDEEAPEEHVPRVTLKIKRPAQDDGDAPRKRTIKISLKTGDSNRSKDEEPRKPSPERDPEPAEDETRSSKEATVEPSPQPAAPAPAPRKIGLKIKRPKPQPAPTAEKADDSPASAPAPAAAPALASASALDSAPAQAQASASASATADTAAPSAPATKTLSSTAATKTSSSAPAIKAPSSAATPKSSVPADEGPLPDEHDTPIQTKKVRAVLQTLMKQKEAAIFLRPIDPVLDGAPTYYDEIKHPMDFGTVDRKFKNGEYATMGDFADDVRLIFSNCRQFNPPGTIPRLLEAAVVKTWRREWGRAMVRKLNYQGKRALQSMLSRLKQHPTGALFLYAVDPVALGIPHYFDIIKREDARDLSLITEKLRSDKYNTVEALDADIRLMLNNAYKFNAGDEPVLNIVRGFDEAYSTEIRALRLSMPDDLGALRTG